MGRSRRLSRSTHHLVRRWRCHIPDKFGRRSRLLASFSRTFTCAAARQSSLGHLRYRKLLLPRMAPRPLALASAITSRGFVPWSGISDISGFFLCHHVLTIPSSSSPYSTHESIPIRPPNISRRAHSHCDATNRALEEPRPDYASPQTTSNFRGGSVAELSRIQPYSCQNRPHGTLPIGTSFNDLSCSLNLRSSIIGSSACR